MAKEKCWKGGVKLRVYDDRLCEECYEINEIQLRKQQQEGVAANVHAPATCTTAIMATDDHLYRPRFEKNETAQRNGSLTISPINHQSPTTNKPSQKILHTSGSTKRNVVDGAADSCCAVCLDALAAIKEELTTTC